MKRIKLQELLMFLLVAIFFIACSKDEESGPIELIPKLDGLYVYGSNTIAASSVEPKAKMALALMAPAKSGNETTKDSIYGKIMHIGANSTIEFALVVGEQNFKYGLPNGGETANGSVVGENDINADLIYGTLSENSAAISIKDEGLYYVLVDMNISHVRIMKFEPQIIGDATELQWSAGTPIPTIYSSIDSTVFELTELPLVGASGYKYRFSNGWELYQTSDFATYTNLGIESYADAWTTREYDVGYFVENIPNHDDGMFTLRLKYDASTGEWQETKTKTGGLQIDYTYTEVGLFGNAYILPSGDTAAWGSGSDGYGLHAPVKSGKAFTWTWDNVNLIQDREFIFLENGAWGGLQLDWSLLSSVEGQAVTDGKLVNATSLGGEYNNFYVVEGGSYNVSLVIDNEADTKVVTITNAK